MQKVGFKALINPGTAYREYANRNSYMKTMEFLSKYDFSSLDIRNNAQIMKEFNDTHNNNVETITWFIPSFEQIFGGIYTILRFANFFHEKKKIKNTFIIQDSKEAANNVKIKIAQAFPNLSAAQVLGVGKESIGTIPYSDIGVATFWSTTYPLLKYNNTKGKFYFIQDYEPLFYPSGVTFALAECTYRFGFHGIINTKGLYDVYTQNYDITATYFTPCVDTKIFYPPEQKNSDLSINDPFSIFFYGRPDKPRNAFELGIAALSKIKKKYGEKVKIYTAGSRWNPRDYYLENEITNLGTLPIAETAELYRKCDLGMVFMFTKHPSYLPFELMACGCTVLTNLNPANEWFLKDGDNCILTEPTVSCISEKIEMLMQRPDLRKKLTSNGLKEVTKSNWDNEMEKIYDFICNKDTKG